MTAELYGLGPSLGGVNSLPSLIGAPTWLVVIMALAMVGALLLRLPTVSAAAGEWHWPATGVALGLIGVLAWLSGARAGWHWGLSITGPSRSLAEAALLAGSDPIGWGGAMLIGIPLGSWVSARLRGPVAWRAPAAPELPRRFVGGLLMGVGGTLASGCNIGNALTGLSVLSVQSLIASAGMVVGALLAIRMLDWRGADAE